MNPKNFFKNIPGALKNFVFKQMPALVYARAKKHRSFLLSILSGALYFLSFPDSNLYLLAWISLIPLLIVVQRENPLKSFLFGFLSGFIANAGLFYWIYVVVQTNTLSRLQGLLCLAALCCYLALYFAAWAYLLNKVKTSYSVFRFSLFAASLWIFFEFIRTYLFSGFPMGIAGYSQWKFLSLIQVSEFTGVFGISFIIVIVNVVLWRVWKTRRVLPFLMIVAGLSLTAILGKILLDRNYLMPPPYFRVAIMQGNIDQYKKWDAAYENEITDAYTKLAAESSAEKPDIIIWPETAVPGYLPADPRLYSWISQLAQLTGTYHIVGAPYYNGGQNYYNASFLFGPAGEILNWHKKTHLIPFGEFVPFRKLLEPYFGVLNTLGDFTRGGSPTVFSVKSVLWGPTICSENFFGSITRKSVSRGAEILVNQTNDAWFLKTSAAELHFTMNVFRAIENRRSVVVSGNTGISGIVEPSGRISARAEPFIRTFICASVGPSRTATFYTRWGDVFAYLCILFCLTMILGTIFNIRIVDALFEMISKFYKEQIRRAR
ncbi:MAG: apolipoprotein N-acyltransferase [Elusimicrobiota bacterium]